MDIKLFLIGEEKEGERPEGGREERDLREGGREDGVDKKVGSVFWCHSPTTLSCICL